VNRPTIHGDGRSEFEDALDVQDRINNVVLDRLVIAKLQAYRQRWIKGMPSEDEDGNPLDLPFVPGVDMLWSVDADPSDVEFGEFSQVDLRRLRHRIDSLVFRRIEARGGDPVPATRAVTFDLDALIGHGWSDH
jgi:hypothetical protein